MQTGSIQSDEHALERIFEAAGCRTQVELAAFLDIRQSSISDAKKRRSIPADWLLKLLLRKSVHPYWILTGIGARFMQASDVPGTEQSTLTDIQTLLRSCAARQLAEELVRRCGERQEKSGGYLRRRWPPRPHRNTENKKR